MDDFRSGYFYLNSESSGELKSYSASSRIGQQHILKLEVTFRSAAEMGYALDELDRLAASIKAKKLAPKAKRPRPLALPAPEADR